MSIVISFTVNFDGRYTDLYLHTPKSVADKIVHNSKQAPNSLVKK